MSIALNHTIVPFRDAQASATFLAEILGRGAPVRFGPFYGVELDNGVTLDFMSTMTLSWSSTTPFWSAKPSSTPSSAASASAG